MPNTLTNGRNTHTNNKHTALIIFLTVVLVHTVAKTCKFVKRKQSRLSPVSVVTTIDDDNYNVALISINARHWNDVCDINVEGEKA